MKQALTALLLALLPACGLLSSPLPTEPPPLRDMEEPIARKDEPADEARRRGLAPGAFTGAYVEPAWFVEPDEPGQPPDGLRIQRIVENSPAAAAGLREGDLLLAVELDGSSSPPARLSWPAQWRQIETDSAPGTRLHLTIDRAGVEQAVDLVLVARVEPAVREAVEHFRESRRAGIVVRTATEVEARGVGLGAGGGAVLIGMAANSPWRSAGLRFGDLVVGVDRQSVDHPQVLLGALRTATGDSLEIEYVRPGAANGDRRRVVLVPLTSRQSEITAVWIPPLFSYSSERDRARTSILFGFLGYESTGAAWEFRFLWLFSVSGGDGDLLREVDR